MRDKDKTLKKTSVNIPDKIYERVDLFAESIGLNRNAALVYLIARGLEYEYDFENYMIRKKKKKLDKEVVQDNIEKSIKHRIHESARQSLTREEWQAVRRAFDGLAFHEYLDSLQDFKKKD